MNLPDAIPMEWAMGEVVVAGRTRTIIAAYGDHERHLCVWLWPEHVNDVLRCERARWATLKRAEKTWARHTLAIAEVVSRGVAYTKCHGGNCPEPCWWRYMGGTITDPTCWLDDHVRKTPDGRWCKYGGGDVSHEFIDDVPINVDAGDAEWRALEAVKTANGRWLAWTAHVETLLLRQLVKEHAPKREGVSARIVVNGRDYWFRTAYNQWRIVVWQRLLFPEDERVDMDLGGLT